MTYAIKKLTFELKPNKLKKTNLKDQFIKAPALPANKNLINCAEK